MKPAVAIICGGGPAPGINTVISTVAKIFLKDGYRVLGIHEGYQGLFSEDPDVKEFDFDHADRIFSRGGSTLIMSRFKPKDEDFNTRIFSKENIQLLVTIGGDDTASTANRVTKFLASKNIIIANIHVPKTIDNDLPLPDRNPTFGFHSAKDEGVRIGNTIYEDARTSRNWFVVTTMGRTAGHLAFGIATGCHFPMMIIPEMFNKTTPTLNKIINLIISSIVKRKLLGVEYGVALVSEGVFHILDNEELRKSGVEFTYDAHGHPELGNVSKSHIFNLLLQKELKRLGIRLKSRPVELGYELRCCRPIGFDLTLCTLLGIGVKKLYDEGKSGCIVSANSRGDITPLYLSEFENKDGKIPPRLVDIDSEIAKLCFQNMHYILEADYEKASAYLPEPEAYDFNKLLNWI
uniref:6-phosphofructokinase n=1 Tax=Roseihalotalea indica TaxID=2867963 RepID=A0AA49GIF7_9BACT|nr:6-phosphofructokinase [Tunicatimonas sp. TK19036]